MDFQFLLFLTISISGYFQNPSISRQSTINDTFQTPPGFERTNASRESFGHFLRHLPLRPKDSKVRFHHGGLKENADVYCGVVDYSLGTKNLQQCADAVMRLRAEYFYKKGAFDKIRFNFLSDGKPRYFVQYASGKTDRKTFDKYLDYVFEFANTASLRKELMPVNSVQEMKIGDVFIIQGTPYGHAVIVVDMAENKQSGKKVFMLAQSYMPAQDIQILVNPNEGNLSPWYELKNGPLVTPEWTFPIGNLRRFRD